MAPSKHWMYVGHGGRNGGNGGGGDKSGDNKNRWDQESKTRYP